METDKPIVEYKRHLRNISLISKLFSEGDVPYIPYRTSEYLYCRVFEAENLSRSDVAIDARNGKVGVGIKTFTYSGKRSQEKIAEFNKLRKEYNFTDPLEKVKYVAKLRNDRIDLVNRLFRLDETIYHCIGRRKGEVFVFEQPMPRIDVENIRLIKNTRSENVINFTDGTEEYAFNDTKSTLYKYFEANDDNTLFAVAVDMADDPLELLDKLYRDVDNSHTQTVDYEKRVVLPLYTIDKTTNSPVVPEKSGLNRWNANGEKRKRRFGEAEVGIRASYRSLVHSILPPRDTPFSAILPNGDEMLLKVSQQDGKALMSNPETALGLWLNLDVLGLQVGELVTYEKLQELGIDSIELTYSKGKWWLNFCKPGTFERYLADNLI